MKVVLESPAPASRPSTPDFRASRRCHRAPRGQEHEFRSHFLRRRLDRVAARPLAAVILTGVLTPETIGLIRVAVAEARRFPDLATSVSRMGRERPTEALTRLFGELAESDGIGASPAFAPDRLPETARRDLVVLPMLVRALFGEDLAVLRAEIGPHVAGSVAFFLAACGYGEARAPGLATPPDAAAGRGRETCAD